MYCPKCKSVLMEIKGQLHGKTVWICRGCETEVSVKLGQNEEFEKRKQEAVVTQRERLISLAAALYRTED